MGIQISILRFLNMSDPAKFIKNRFDPDTQEKWIASQWWSWNDDSVLQAFTEIMTRPALHGEKSDNGDK